MKRNALMAFSIITAVMLAGCESTGPKTQTGAVGGGVLGAIAGGIIGHQSGHGLEGAAIGGTVGALGGAVVGNSWDQQDRQALATNPNHITVIQIADMAQKGIPDDVIISEIDRTHSVYNLTSEVIAYLKQNKVGDKVINRMLSTSVVK